MHFNSYILHFAKENQKGTFDIIQKDFSQVNEPETVIGTDSYTIIASACLAEGKKTKIVTLNSLREIKVYQNE